MFVEHKEVGETKEAPAKTLKLSEAIRIGKPLVSEDTSSFRLCAIGCAWAGIKGYEMTFEELIDFEKARGRDPIEAHIADALGYERHLFYWVNKQHCGGKSALSIADDLESRGL